MSDREEVQHRLAEFLALLKWPDGRTVYDAPSGVVEELMPVASGGYLRTITFGCRGTLDAVAYVSRPNRISVRAEGRLAGRVNGDYGSLDEARTALDLTRPE